LSRHQPKGERHRHEDDSEEQRRSALTSRLTQRRTLEKTAIGKVVADGPVTKLAITRSSSDNVNARSQDPACERSQLHMVSHTTAAPARTGREKILVEAARLLS